MTWLEREAAQLRVDEGVRLKPYLDTEGVATIGIGRNLDSKGISRDEAEYLFANDLREAHDECRRRIPIFPYLDEDRRGVLVNMMFNLGWPRLSTFRRFLAALDRQDWATASYEMERSLWYSQVGARAARLVARMQGGRYV